MLLQAGLPNQFWPYATQAFCHALNTSVKNGEPRYNLRHKKGYFNGKILPFGCLIDYYPTKRTYRKKEGAKSVDADDEDEDDHEDEDIKENRDKVDLDVDDSKPSPHDKHLIDELNHGDTDLPKFSPRAVPGMFRYRLSPGGIWKGEYYVANLADLRNGKRKPRLSL